ncbi:transposase family protein [Rhabdochlamydiaceae symbiont of Dictyostelium giganteum]|uniref:helix-turn-helix domain-containing protein n=1 Tax=Rhabdochlamydiaceae symbiont of Dictyostelium giganteum TaxID=3342349 RepID=UPI00384C12F6
MEYERVKKFSDKDFRRFTGMQRSAFEKMIEILQEANLKKKSQLPVGDQLLMALEYIRQHRTYLHIAVDYGVSETVARKMIHWVEDTLIQDPVFASLKNKVRLKSDIEYEVFVIKDTKTLLEYFEENEMESDPYPE